jgi:hypothetical protein
MMFLAIWARTPHNLAAAQMMETNIALQEADEQACLNRVEVIRVKFAKNSKTEGHHQREGGELVNFRM